MNDLFTTKGTLTVSIGEGCLSSFEASTVKKGDIVRTTRIAGTPLMMHFNGMRLCPCAPHTDLPAARLDSRRVVRTQSS